MGIPQNRCGFELSPKLLIGRGSVDEQIAERLMERDPDAWRGEFHVACCWRPVWADTSRCLWHAEVGEKQIDALVSARSDETDPVVLDGAFLPQLGLGDRIPFRDCRAIAVDLSGADLQDADLSGAALGYADLSDAVLFGADLSGANLGRADLSRANLFGADLSDADLFGADLSRAFLWDASLSGADLRGADLSDALLGGADLSGADLWHADLSGANLWSADLSGADLRHADLTGADLRETTLGNLRLNQESRIRTLDQTDASEPYEFDSLARTYHALGEAAKENGLVGKARWLRIRERRARRREARANGDWRAWAGSLASEWTMGYGVSIGRVSIAILFIIAGCAALYWVFGVSHGTTPLARGFDALDYSLAIFTGIGRADGPPLTQPARSVAFLEAFAGILFSVLLGYILGTREAP